MNKKLVFRGAACAFAGAVCTLLILAVVVFVSGRYGYSSSDSYDYNGYYSSSSVAGGVSSGFGAVNKGGMLADVAYAPEYMESSSSASYDSTSSSGGNSTVDLGARKVIFWASINAETTTYDRYVAWLDARVQSLGGYFENKEVTVHNRGYDLREYRNMSATIRVPKASLSDFLNDMDAEGNVTYRREGRDDVTDSYTDTDAHLESVRIEQQRLNELLEIAETVDDILSIEDRLSYVRYEIESYERRLRGYDSQIEYSTVNLELTEVLEYTEPVPEGFFERCLRELSDNIEWLGMFAQDSFVFVFGHLPSIAVGAVVVFGAVKLRKCLRRKKTAAKSAEASIVSDESLPL